MIDRRCAVLNVVGLRPDHIGVNTPNINEFCKHGFIEPLGGVFPALTTTAQSSMLTGKLPNEHGVVGNGWYDRCLADVLFWKQSNALVQSPKVWDAIRELSLDFKCSKLFWWYNMYAAVDASITPRPHYPADGRKIIDLYSTPKGLHQAIEERIGKFPFFNFWGPKAGIEASQWIAKAAKIEHQVNAPNMQFVYLPHLDYCMQKVGASSPIIANELLAIDDVVGDLVEYYESKNTDVLIVSEYGIQDVSTPVHINRVLREAGHIQVRDSLTWELLDYGASSAFAVADHQIAHIYINESQKYAEIKKLLENTPGVERVLDQAGKREFKVDHERAGDLIAIAEKNAWFTYYYWLDDAKAPDFARTVDIHRKPGYDPVEMFLDPTIKLPPAKIAWRLLQKKMGMRMLMDVIPLDATLIGGSHGRLPDLPEEGAVIIGGKKFKALLGKYTSVKMTDVHDLLLRWAQ